MFFIIVTYDEAVFIVKAYACYYYFLVHWRITRHADVRWPSGRASDSGARGRGFDPHSGRCILEQETFTSQKSTDNTQEAMAPSRHD